MKLALFSVLLAGACATSSGGDPDASLFADAATNTPDAAPVDDSDANASASAACPDGELATYITSGGDVTCAPIADAAAVAVRSRCAIYLGQKDSCDGCDDPPSKWSANGTLMCTEGEGAGNACLIATMGDPPTSIELATLDLDGDVNDDDKLYTTLHCVAAPRAPQPAPCAPGWAIAARSGDGWTCKPISEAVVEYMGSRCGAYLGWRDNCGGCEDPPTKWGFANDSGCSNGAGNNNSCIAATLGGESVNLFGLNTDGDVDDNDKLYLGLYCDAQAVADSPSSGSCPDGQFVVATNGDGTFQCADPTAAFASYIEDSCSMVFGWHDSCDACTEAPIKWGRTSTGGCANGAGAGNTCIQAALGDADVHLFGLDSDGDVNSDDTLYVGFRCE